ncbi:MAG: HlyD family secretion protein [Chlamydiales bacterium]|jgi:HlyD family secretion protein
MKYGLAQLRRSLFWMIVVGGAAAAIYSLVLRPIDVRQCEVSVGVVSVDALGTGSVESRRVVDISFEVTGRVTRINVDQADRVKAGQELAAIDDRTFLADVALAEQGVLLAESTLQRLEADIERSRAVLKGAEDGLARVEPLVQSGVATRESLDVAEERHQVAVAELSRAHAAQFEGRESVATARRELDRAGAELERSVVRSPFDGVVLRRAREVGDVAVPGAAVLKLAATDTIWASVWVDETYLDSLATGLPASIALRSDPQRPVRGTVARIGREVDRETRELLVDVKFDDVPDKIAFGQRVDLWIELERKADVVRVPGRVVVEVEGRAGVFVARESRARFQALELGAHGRDFVEVLSGLSRESVVLDPRVKGSALLKDGDRIRLPDAGSAGASR